MNQRLTGLFGHQAALQIASELDKGTEISFKIQILQLAHSIMEGELEGLPLNKDDTPREHYIIQELQAICLEENVFSIRSFMTFRLAKYYERLRSYVEAAIDEYKMEQEYQTFIQSLRDYVMSKVAEPKDD